MRLENDDKVIGMEILDEGATILTVTERGYGKRTPTGAYRLKSRGGKGIITIKTGGRNGDVIGIRQVEGAEHLLMVTNHGQLIRTLVGQVSVVGRNTMGVRLFNLSEDSSVVGMECIIVDEDEEIEVDGEDSAEGTAAEEAAPEADAPAEEEAGDEAEGDDESSDDGE